MRGFDGEAFGAEMAEMVRDYVRRALDERLGGPHPLMRHFGVWKSTKAYPAGAFVTLNGSGWVAQEPTDIGERPGAGETAWKLAVKADHK